MKRRYPKKVHVEKFRSYVKPPRELVCRRCGNTFDHKGRGTPKYCLKCRAYAIDESHKRSRERRRATRIVK